VVLLAVLSVVRVHWLNGANFGDGLGAGFKAGIIGGVAGGLINGITSGIRAVGDNRTFWSGQKWNEIIVGSKNQGYFTSASDFMDKWDTDLSMDVPYSEQAGEMGCTFSCKSSADKFFNMQGQDKIITDWLKKTTDLKSLKILSGNLESYYKAAGYNTNPYSGNFSSSESLPWIANEMSSNRLTHVQWNSTAGGHASLITKIQYLSDFSKYRLFIMDPNFVSPQRFYMNKTFNMFSLWKK
jgi:hypothetical protein